MEIHKALRPLLVLVLMAMLAALWLRRRGMPDIERLRRAVWPTRLAIALLVYLVVSAVAYAFLPSFNNNFEPVVAVNSVLMAVGKPIYLSLDSPDCVSTHYGPASFVLAAALNRLDFAPIFAAKIAGVFQCLSGLLILGLCAAQRFGTVAAIRSVAFTTIVLLLGKHIAYSIRPDSLQVLGICLVAGAILLKTRLAIVLVGMGAGILLGAKVHALLYVLPMLPMFLRRHGIRGVAIAAAIAFVLLALPFMTLSSVSLSGYVEQLTQVGGRHQLVFGLFLWAVSHFVVISVPFLFGVLALRRRYGPGVRGNVLWQSLLVFLVCMAVVCVLSSKEGASPHHLWPFGPVLAVLGLFLIEEFGPFVFEGPHRLRHAALATAYVGTLLLGLVAAQKRVVRYFYRDTNIAAVRREIIELTEKYARSSMTMGCGDGKNEYYTYLRPIVVGHAKEGFLESPTVLDYALAGHPLPNASIKKMRDQYFDVFFIPVGGKPFSLQLGENRDLLLFGDELQNAFLESYIQVSAGNYFAVWKAKRLM